MITAPNTELVRVAQGALSGSEIDGLYVFKGVPYAAPPIGELRWNPPQPAKAWDGVRPATEFQERCIQNQDLGIFSAAGGKEDCLYLNIYAPKEAVRQNDHLPVLVWIHGGSFWVGSGNDYDASRLAKQGNAVVVTVNYRLGLLGFFAHPALVEEGKPVGNYGIMDQQAALAWIKQNISAFGGDPDNVTIFGESSGGACVFTHALAPGSAGLFHHGIAMSGAALVLRYPAFGAPKPFSVAQELGLQFTQALGCEANEAEFLRSLPVETILQNQFPYLHNQPMIDGVTLIDHPADLMRSASLNCSSIINGVTRNEGTFFAALAEAATGIPMTESGYREAIEGFYGPEIAPLVIQEYPTSAYSTPSETYAAAVTASLFASTANLVNKLLAGRINIYAYEFADENAPSYVGDVSFSMGASHTFELPYLFPGFNGAGLHSVRLDTAQEDLSRYMTTYWTGIGRQKEVRWDWPLYNPDADNVLVLAPPRPILSEVSFRVRHKCAFWDRTGLY